MTTTTVWDSSSTKRVSSHRTATASSTSVRGECGTIRIAAARKCGVNRRVALRSNSIFQNFVDEGRLERPLNDYNCWFLSRRRLDWGLSGHDFGCN